ncbi:MAG: protease pro-enzyme activation domain-containing protein [Firmicutes bacterium]|nr:protease pro-enzyme activation domain-containing protein [Bacillota bacterium]
MAKTLRRAAMVGAATTLLSTALFSVSAYAATNLMQVGSDVLSVPSDAVNLGSVPASQSMQVTVAMQPSAGLAAYVQQLQSEPLANRSYLTPSEIGDKFGSPDYSAMSSYLQSQGLTVTTNPGGLMMEASGSAAQIEQAFHVSVDQYKTPTLSFFSATSQPLLPGSLAPSVTSVVGLSDQTVVKPMVLHANVSGQQVGTTPTGTDLPGYYLPTDIHTAYDLNNVYNEGITGQGETIAIMTLADLTPSDVQYFWQNTGLPAQPTLTIVPVDWLSSGPSFSGSDESTLDAEESGAMAPGANILEYVGSGPSLQAMIDTYLHIVSQDKAQVMTGSWGAPEDETPTSFMNAENDLFMQAAAEGISNYAASGDSAAYDDPNTSSPTVDFPASDPYVSAAGGTSLYLNPDDDSRVEETAWTYNPALGWGSGGGYSAYFKEPTWEQNAGIADPTLMNGLPDVALNADPLTGYQIYYEGAWNSGYGGTSFAAPEWAGITALADQALGKSLGFVNPLWFSLCQTGEYATAFHDITEGNNGAYSAGTGWDPVTGWGTPDVFNLIADLQSPLPMFMTFTASPSNPGPGQSVQLTATVTDVKGQPIAGQQVALNYGNTNVNASSTLATTNSQGEAVFTVSDAQPDSVQFIASAMSAGQVAPATVTVNW